MDMLEALQMEQPLNQLGDGAVHSIYLADCMLIELIIQGIHKVVGDVEAPETAYPTHEHGPIAVSNN